jgi:hypothetical protein
MAGRSVQQSPAFAALSVGGVRVFHVILDQVGHDGAAMSLRQLMDLSGLCRSSVRIGIKQCELVEFVSVTMGHRRINTFTLSDGWKSLDADEAARRVKLARSPMPPRQRVSPRPVPQVQAPGERSSHAF